MDVSSFLEWPAERLTAHQAPALLVERALAIVGNGGRVRVKPHDGLDCLQLTEACAQAMAVIMGLRLRGEGQSMAASGVLAFVAGSGVVWYFDPTKAGFFPVCPLFTLTGYACPGCGLTRGFHALFNGDVTTALHYNALIPLFSLIFAFGLILMMLVAVKGIAIPKWVYSPKPLFAFFILLVIFGLILYPKVNVLSRKNDPSSINLSEPNEL